MNEEGRMTRKVLSVIFFFVLVAGLFHLSNVVLFEKQHFGTAKNIAYEEAEKIDVFFIGPSHIFYGINPMTIWEETGIAGYNLTTHQQPLWTSKLLLKHALKHQHPKLIVFDVLMATNFGRPLIGTEQGTNMTHLALDPVPLSLQKIKGVLKTDSITEKGEILLPIILNHSRLQQGLLSYDDFHFFTGDRSHPTKGYNYTQNTLSYDCPIVPNTDYTHELPEGMEAILIDFIEFCHDQKLPLLFIKTPLVGNEELYGQINLIGKIAAEHEVPFLNFNLLFDDIGIDFSTDFADSGHLNVHGAEKVSKYLADYISVHYDLPDHRGEDAYNSWDLAARHFNTLTVLPKSDDLTDFFTAANDHNLLITVQIGGKLEKPIQIPQEMLSAMQAAGFSRIPDHTGSGTYYAVLKGGKIILENRSDSEILTDEFMVKDTRFAIHVSPKEPDGGSFMTALYIGNGGYALTEPGMMVTAYDMDRMEKITAVRCFFDETGVIEHIK